MDFCHSVRKARQLIERRASRGVVIVARVHVIIVSLIFGAVVLEGAVWWMMPMVVRHPARLYVSQDIRVNLKGVEASSSSGI